MTQVFVFGTLRHAPILQLVAGDAGLTPRPAMLQDTRCLRALRGDWPVLQDTPGAQAEGQLLDVGAEACARLDFYEACFGYHRVPCRVMTPQGAVSADVWRPAEAGQNRGAEMDWVLSDWVADHAALSLAVAEEMMRAFGRETPQQVAARMAIIRSRAQAGLRTAMWRRPGLIGRAPATDQIETLARAHPYDGFHSVETRTLRHRRFDGSWSVPVDRAVFRATDAVTVLPYDPVTDRLLVVEQIRLGPLIQGDPAPWLLEPVAGMIDAGETDIEAARRETLEEAGVTLGDLHLVARYYPTPGGVAQVLHSYVGIADLQSEGGWTGGHAGEDEDIHAHVISYAQGVELLRAGDMANAAMLVSMQWLMMQRDVLRQELSHDDPAAV